MQEKRATSCDNYMKHINTVLR